LVNGLFFIFDLLRKSKISFWLDSGTLLGIYREKAIIKWDSDIDIGIWDSDIEKLLSLSKSIKQLGYKFRKRSFKGKIYGFTFDSKKNSLDLPIHVHVYFNKNNFAWSPQTVIYDPKFDVIPDWIEQNPSIWRDFFSACKMNALKIRDKQKTRILEKVFIMLTSYPIWGLFILSKSNLDRYIWANYWPYKYFHKTYTWKVPAEYFENIKDIKIGNTMVPIPEKSDEYLQARYGDWRQPDRNWIYWRDDGCIIAESSEKLLPEIF